MLVVGFFSVQEPGTMLEEFSSPLVVKVKKFTEQHHRVEV
jgi:hypothetical protein